MTKWLRNEKGFTMVEMMVVLIIIAVLMGGGMTFYQRYIENARVTKAKTQLIVMEAALDAYYAEKNAYPDTTNELNQAGLVPDGALNDNDISHATNGVQLSATDPWGSKYEYKVNVGETTYVLETGYSTVRGSSNTVVMGTGTSGASTAPDVGTASVTIP